MSIKSGGNIGCLEFEIRWYNFIGHQNIKRDVFHIRHQSPYEIPLKKIHV